ncbi:MAG: LLM class flavin-dependent oxidoreductase [Chloroflexi bacterium]|nr:LLM class flavin-dependent oxidoreductase [Chloroflexota bacterium]
MSARRVRFGIRLIDDLGGPSELAALGVLAEELGFDVLLFPHSPFRANSWVLNSLVAGRTSRIELSSGGPSRTADPSEVATYIATLDHLSHGRVSVRMGAHNFETLRWIGIPRGEEDVVPRVREGVEILRRMLRGERGHDGSIYRWDENAYLRFAPYRREIPIAISAIGEPLLELSGEIGDGSHPMVTPPESAPLIMAPIRRGLERSSAPGRSFEATAYVWMAVSEDGDEARALLADIVSYYGYHLDPRALATIDLTLEDFRPVYDVRMRHGREAARPLVTPAMLRTGIAGTPEECVRQLRIIVDAGFDNVNIGGPIGRDPARAMRLIADRVIPSFR